MVEHTTGTVNLLTRNDRLVGSRQALSYVLGPPFPAASVAAAHEF
jgi:hypothetical protein